MINATKFIAEQNGYIITVSLGGIYPYWSIIKEGVIVDEAINHSPITTHFNKELACKSQVEKYFADLLTAYK